jgi:hypothetical protein
MVARESIRLHLDQCRHDSHPFASASEHEDYRVEPVGRPPTQLETKRRATQRVLSDASNEREADRVANGPEIAKTAGLSSKARAMAREKDQISKGFNIDPAELSAQHVFNIGNAFLVLGNRLLQHNTTVLGLLTHGLLKQLVETYVLNRVRITELHQQLH